MKTGISLLDLKLGARMLARSPGLTLVGGIGMAVAIAIGAGSFAFFHSHMYPTLPLDEGDRIVAVENWNVAANNEERQSLHDFAAWRRELRMVVDLGAFRTIARNLLLPGAPPEPVQIAEMSASGFRVARVPPLLGRPLVDEDEREGAAPVVVLGYEAWQSRFAGDPAVVGRQVRLGSTAHTVVGVMPEGFAFPLNHRYWTALRTDPSRFERGDGPEIHVFGRLAPGVTRDQAQAELTTVGARASAAFPKTHANLRPRVMTYTYPLLDIQDVTLWGVGLMQMAVSMLLVVVCINVSILVYARTATRRGEIAVRSALGASRGRIVAQLFAEALVLSAGAAVAGLTLAQVGLRYGNAIMEQDTGSSPFWADYGLSAPTVAYVVALTLLAAVIVGVVPALQATGKKMQASLRQLGGGTGIRLGRTWTVLIVAQVAVAVAALPAAIALGWEQVRQATIRPTFAADEFLAAGLAMDRDLAGADAGVTAAEMDARYGGRLAELLRRVRAEPGVAAVTFASALPGSEPGVAVEVDGVPAPAESPAGHTVRFSTVSGGYFDALGVPVLSGRGFAPADMGEAAGAVVVNRTFVRQVLGGGNAVGRRVRYAAASLTEEGEDPETVLPGRWFEVVGVVEDLHANPLDAELMEPAMFHPAAPGQLHPVFLAVRVRGTDPASFAPRLREVAAALDPALRLGAVRSLDAIDRQQQLALRLVGLVVTLVTASVLLLSAAGIYALMSFTVTRRRREIGIRAALGGDPGRILRTIFSRAAGQLALGLGVGVAAAALLDAATGGVMLGGKGMILLPAVSAMMLAAGLLAALGPARRGLRIEPTEALKADA